MAHPLVVQLKFARSEFQRCLEGVTPEDAIQRLKPMNAIGWIIGHLANQENGYWVRFAQDQVLYPELRALVGFGQPATTPPLDEMWAIWYEVTRKADLYLENLTQDQLGTYLTVKGKPLGENIGTLLYRNIYHYWYHTGEANAIRQLLGHDNVPEFVGSFGAAAHPDAG